MSSNKTLSKIKYALKFLPDSAYIQLYYFAHFKRFCNLKNPETYNEKLNWLKIHDRRPEYIKMVDKYEAKQYVSNLIGKEYIIPTLGVWDSFDDIDFDNLPKQFVLKCTHDSEGVVLVKDKDHFDFLKAKDKLTKALKKNFFYIGREWPYKSVKPRILAEEYMEDEKFGELRDYKFFCFNGEPKAMFIASDRAKGETKFDYFDMNFNHLDIRQKYPNSTEPLEKPDKFDEMVNVARLLSQGYPHIRVDLYEVNGNIYFGELTLYHFSGFMPFYPKTWDKVFGDWLLLPNK